MKGKNMNMNKKDKENIKKIDALRMRLVNEEKERGGLALYYFFYKADKAPNTLLFEL